VNTYTHLCTYGERERERGREGGREGERLLISNEDETDTHTHSRASFSERKRKNHMTKNAFQYKKSRTKSLIQKRKPRMHPPQETK
jgi:hypothetical protein